MKRRLPLALVFLAGRRRMNSTLRPPRPSAPRVEQIEANLERWRWLPRDLGNPYVEVNKRDERLLAMLH